MTSLLPAPAGLRVLVVDDDADTVESTAMLLAMHGHQASIARNGKEALERANSDRPDIILLDIAMPGMDGYEVAQTLKRDPAQLPAPMIVAVTGYATPADKRRGADAGFDLHLTKPVDFSLFDQLAAVLAETGRLAEQTRTLAQTQTTTTFADFIRIEIEMAGTLLDVASTTSRVENRLRALAKAQSALEVVEKCLVKEPGAQHELRAALVTLRQRHEDLSS